MAIEGNQTNRSQRIPGLAATVPYLLGMLLIYIGERLVSSPQNMRFLLDSIGGALIIWALLARLYNWVRATEGQKAVEGRILLSYLGGVVALAVYAAQLTPVYQVLLPALQDTKAISRYQAVLQVMWPIMFIARLSHQLVQVARQL